MSEGEHFVIQKGKAQCNKGTSFPKFKVTTHKQHYWNNGKGNPDFLAVTENDLTFDPPVKPFGSCSIKNNNPCAFAPSGKWTKTYDKTKVMGLCCVIESSELMCATGGKITVMQHGQTSAISASNAKEAKPQVQEELDPVTDLGIIQEEDDLDYI